MKNLKLISRLFLLSLLAFFTWNTSVGQKAQKHLIKKPQLRNLPTIDKKFTQNEYIIEDLILLSKQQELNALSKKMSELKLQITQLKSKVAKKIPKRKSNMLRLSSVTSEKVSEQVLCSYLHERCSFEPNIEICSYISELCFSFDLARVVGPEIPDPPCPTGECPYDFLSKIYVYPPFSPYILTLENSLSGKVLTKGKDSNVSSNFVKDYKLLNLNTDNINMKQPLSLVIKNKSTQEVHTISLTH